MLLENANLCSPTVLDRLNPLLEIGGTLLVSECGMRDGEPRVITAHPGFRLFLALDPRRGDVSRAMRNRGVEVGSGSYCPPRPPPLHLLLFLILRLLRCFLLLLLLPSSSVSSFFT